MPLTAVTTTKVIYSGGDLTDGTGVSSSNTNSNAPAAGEAYLSLASGANTVTFPTGFTLNGVDIIPPSGNTTALTLKGIAGDTGIRLHNTVTTRVAIDSSVLSIVLNAASAMTVRLAYW